MKLSGDQWVRVKSIVMDAMELPTRERRPFVDRACGSDAAVRAEVDALLAADDLADAHARGDGESSPRFPRLFDPPQATPGSIALPDSGGSMLVGRRLGRYVITRLIGMGGMGAVYEAMQDGLPRPVALKVMRAGLISQSARARFQREVQVLARLEHPGIARIYDSGVHESELGPIPYFAMELIAGARPITEHARACGLSLRERVAMFADICDAVQHGHQRGIIHRDLKPTNILVGRIGDDTGEQVAKVIDFGIARSTDADMTLATLETARDAMPGTLAYMSPEQCDRDPADLDIRSDVYALGVVLYELLVGRLPYDVVDKPLPEAVRIIQQEPARRPSVIEPRLTGDLSVIVLTCLAKYRESRYGSAAELAGDLRRWLDHLPIAARRASRWYQARMFVRRHRTIALAGAAVTVAVIAGLISTSVGLHRALIERDRAKAAERLALQEKARAERVAEFLQGVLRATSAPVLATRSVDPSISPIAARLARASRLSDGGRPESLRDVTVRVRRGLDAGSMGDPVLEAELRLVTLQLLMTQVASSVENEELVRSAPSELDAASRVLGPAHESVLATAIALSGFIAGSGDMRGAAALLAPHHDAACRAFGPGDVRSLEIGRQLLQTLTDDADGDTRRTLAERLLRDAIAAHGLLARPTLACRLAMGQYLLGTADAAGASAEGRAVLEALGPEAGDSDELVQWALALSIADLLIHPPDRQTLERVLEVQMRILRGVEASSGADPRVMFDAVGTPLLTLARLGDLARAEPLMRSIAQTAERRFGPTFHVTTKSKSRVARLLIWSGQDSAEALRLAQTAYVDGVAGSGVPLGDYEVFDHATVLDARRTLGEADAALAGIDALVAAYTERSGGHLSWFGGYLHMVAAQALEDLGRTDEARLRWRQAWSEIDESQPPASVLRIMALRQGSGFFHRHGPEADAMVWRDRLEAIALPAEPIRPD